MHYKFKSNQKLNWKPVFKLLKINTKFTNRGKLSKNKEFKYVMVFFCCDNWLDFGLEFIWPFNMGVHLKTEKVSLGNFIKTEFSYHFWLGINCDFLFK